MEFLDTASSDENRVDFADDEIQIVKTALHTKLFRRDESVDERTAKFKALIDALATKFGLPQLTLEVADNEEAGWGTFDRNANKIIINRRFSLTTTLFCFGVALVIHKPEVQAAMVAGHYNPMAFALSLFKQSAPRMFEQAKNAGRLAGTSVPYTDGGRMPINGESMGVDDDDGDDVPPTPRQHPLPPPRTPPSQRPDIDPENRKDRGNGLGED